MNDDLNAMLRELGDAPAPPVDPVFVHQLDRRIGVEALAGRERRAIRAAFVHGTISVMSVLLGGAAFNWLLPGWNAALAAAVAAFLCLWMLLVDWQWPDMRLDPAGE